jgi:alkanesulfonate monooxygenase SsuD/methylene tetrahydromethanopterin reductase-like flavin-dependent oxidoreductase (luciferase family)
MMPQILEAWATPPPTPLPGGSQADGARQHRKHAAGRIAAQTTPPLAQEERRALRPGAQRRASDPILTQCLPRGVVHGHDTGHAELALADPRAYLLRALYAAIAHRGAVTYPEDLTRASTA